MRHGVVDSDFQDQWFSILVDNIVYMTMTGTLRASVHWKICLSGPGFYLPLFMDLIHLDSSSLLVFARF